MARPIAAALAVSLAGSLAAPAFGAEAFGDARFVDAASVSAGCLAAASSVPLYLPDVAATPEQIAAEGRYWTWRLRDAAPDEPDQIEYWEEAHVWLDGELKGREPSAARDFLATYRGRCVIAQAQAQSEAMWEAAR